MAREHASVQVPTIWTLSSTKGVYKVAEASDRPTLPTWNQTDHLHRQHIASPPVQTTTESSCCTDMPTVQALGLILNRKKSLLLPVQYLEFLGFQVC